VTTVSDIAMTEVDVIDRMIQAAQAGIGELRARLQLEERYLEDLHRRRQEAASTAEMLSGPGSSPSANGSGVRRGTARIHANSTASHILAILETAGHEMELGDIAQALEKRVSSPRHKDGMRASAYAAISRRRDLFEQVSPGVYDLTSRRSSGQVEVKGR
jgi:hypothetical protein